MSATDALEAERVRLVACLVAVHDQMRAAARADAKPSCTACGGGGMAPRSFGLVVCSCVARDNRVSVCGRAQ